MPGSNRNYEYVLQPPSLGASYTSNDGNSVSSSSSPQPSHTASSGSGSMLPVLLTIAMSMEMGCPACWGSAGVTRGSRAPVVLTAPCPQPAGPCRDTEPLLGVHCSRLPPPSSRSLSALLCCAQPSPPFTSSCHLWARS